MPTISIKSGSREITIPLLTHAIERERRIIMDSLSISRGKVAALARELSVDVDALMKGEVEHTESNDMKLIELEGEIEIMRHLEGELKELDTLEIC